MLVDGNGLRLSGTLRSPTNEDVGDRVAAELAGVSKEASRTSRLLGLGAWQAIAVESPEGNLFLVRSHAGDGAADRAGSVASRWRGWA